MNHWISGSDYVDWLPLFSWGRETWRKRRDGRAPSIYHNIILMVFVQSARKRGVSSVSVRIPVKKENQLSACVCVCVKWCLLQEIGSCDCGDCKWLRGNSEISRVGHQEGQVENTGEGADISFHRRVFFPLLREASILLFSSCIQITLSRG